MQNIRRQLAATYFSFDTRSLAAFRIALGLVLWLDLGLRAAVLDSFYTNSGILPNHTLLWAQPQQYMFSLFFSASLRHEAAWLMAGCGLVFSALIAGYHTKWAQALCLLAVVSLNTRLSPLENGGDMLLSGLCMWSLFLPLGERFSFDSVRASLRRREQQSPAELNDRRPIRTPARRFYSLACFGLICQFVAIYALNALHKNGQTWLSGDAVHYALHQDRIVKLPGVWLREHATPGVLHALTYATIAAEAFAALAIASPFVARYFRLAAILLMPAVHLAFEVCLDVGIFSFVMLAFYPLLLAPEHWEFLRKHAQRWHKRRVVFVDDDCGFCMLCARLLARLDLLERLEFASNADQDRLPRSISLTQADESITTLEPDSGRVQRGAAAFAALLRSIPFGFSVAIPLMLPGLRGVSEWAYQHVARNRLQISIWLGYGACGLPQAGGVTSTAADERSEAGLLLDKGRVFAREACVLVYLLAAGSELLNSNAAIPAALHHRQPALLSMLVQYPRAFQIWRMFAPDAPKQDFMLEVDALTAGGKRVDPYNEIASRVPGPGYTRIPERLNQNQFFWGYSVFAVQPYFEPYSTAFAEWIARYPERTGDPNDRIVSFRVYKLSDESPPPGQTRATQFKREFLFGGP